MFVTTILWAGVLLFCKDVPLWQARASLGRARRSLPGLPSSQLSLMGLPHGASQGGFPDGASLMGLLQAASLMGRP